MPDETEPDTEFLTYRITCNRDRNVITSHMYSGRCSIKGRISSIISIIFTFPSHYKISIYPHEGMVYSTNNDKAQT